MNMYIYVQRLKCVHASHAFFVSVFVHEDLDTATLKFVFPVLAASLIKNGFNFILNIH